MKFVVTNLTHIAMVTTSISREGGGITPVVRSMAMALHEDEAFRCSVHGLEDRYSNTAREAWGDIPVSSHIAYSPTAWAYSPSLTKTLVSSDATLIHRHGIWNYPSRAVAIACQKNSVPYVVSIHGMLNPSALEISALRKRIFGLLFERRFLRRAACLHALSRIEAEAIRSYGLLNPIAIIPNGIDPPAPQTSSLPPWPSGNDGRKVLLYIGRLHPIKGLPTFLRAFARTSDEIRRARWRLVIAGWDQNGHRKELERLVRELAISRDVDFVGGLFDTEKTNALHMADAFVLPSTSEAQPVAVLEAWVHGLPTLLTTACNLPTAKTEKLGLVCNNSVEEFAASLQQLITMPKEELREMGSRAQVYTRAEYCWKTQSEKLKQVYAWICRNGDRPGCLFER